MQTDRLGARAGRSRRLGYAWASVCAGLALSAAGCSDESSPEPASGGSGASGGTMSSGGSAGDSGGSSSKSPRVNQLRIGMGQCLAEPLSTGLPGSAADGRTTCEVAEVTSASCDCAAPGRGPLAAATMALVRGELAANGLCGAEVGIECDSYCGCAILQVSGTAADPSSGLYACQNEVTLRDSALTGFCVLDAERTDASGEPAPLGSPELLLDCPETAQRRVRFVGPQTPATGGVVFLVCP